MKFLRLKTVLVSFCLSQGLSSFSVADSHAYPTLQLDIASGSYDFSTDTIVATGNTFTLYAYLIQNNRNFCQIPIISLPRFLLRSERTAQILAHLPSMEQMLMLQVVWMPMVCHL